MLATFAVEIVMAIYTVWRYKMTTTTRLITAALAMLALFQLSEYYDCTGLGINAADWSRVGYAAITTLPPLGLHLLHKLGDKPNRPEYEKRDARKEQRPVVGSRTNGRRHGFDVVHSTP